MKKLLAIVLSLLTVFSIVSPAAAVNEEKLPIIYLAGKGNSPIYKTDADGNFLLDENGQKIEAANLKQPGGMSRGDYILSKLEPVLSELLFALASGNYEDYIQSLVDSFAPIYQDIVFDENGENNYSKIDWDYSVQTPTRGAGGFNYYYFNYDWRYSVYDTADQLHQFVEYVCQKEGVDKVNIHGRCLGSNVAMAYVAKSEAGLYDTPFRVKNFVLNTTPVDGYITLGALLSGSVTFDDDTMDRFVSLYLNGSDIFEDPLLESTAVVFVSLMNQAKILGWGCEKVQEFYEKIDDELVPQLALVSYGSFPSYWSMVGNDYYDKAKSVVFGKVQAEGKYLSTIEKIDEYYNMISACDPETGAPLYESILKRCESDYGMKTAVFAKYGSPSMPIFEGSEITGDARGTVTELSLGAIGTTVGESFTDAQLKKLEALDGYNAKYLSPDKKVYAGTCLFPETTWFSKNMAHDQLNQIDPIATEFFLADGNFTVDSDARYPQFHEYTNGKFNVVSQEDEADKLWANNPYVVLIRFIKLVLKFLTALINGDLAFDFGFNSLVK